MSENLTDLLDCLPPVARGDRVSVPRETYERVRLAIAEIAAAEERGRRAGIEEERKRAMSVVHILHQCIRGKCACADNGAMSQFACEDTARKAIDAWADLAPRDSGKRKHRCMRCGDEFDCTAPGCVALYDVLPAMIRGGVVVEHECKPREDRK